MILKHECIYVKKYHILTGYKDNNDTCLCRKQHSHKYIISAIYFPIFKWSKEIYREHNKQIWKHGYQLVKTGRGHRSIRWIS